MQKTIYRHTIYSFLHEKSRQKCGDAIFSASVAAPGIPLFFGIFTEILLRAKKSYFPSIFALSDFPVNLLRDISFHMDALRQILLLLQLSEAADHLDLSCLLIGENPIHINFSAF